METEDEEGTCYFIHYEGGKLRMLKIGPDGEAVEVFIRFDGDLLDKDSVTEAIENAGPMFGECCKAEICKDELSVVINLVSENGTKKVINLPYDLTRKSISH